MIEDLIRGWEHFISRPSGPFHLRFLIQPAVGIVMALISGVKDAKAGNPPYLWKMFTNEDYRKALLKDGWKDMGTPFILSLVLDTIYQLISFQTVYVFELLFTAFFLTLMPYLILRGLVTRVSQLFIKH